MSPQLPNLPIDPGAVAGKARDLLTRLGPTSSEARRSLPIDRDPAEVRALWEDEGARRAVLDGVPVAEATLDFGAEQPGWGTTATVGLTLSTPMPGMQTRALAGKVVRRLKSLAETGEVPTTAFNPSARADAGEPTADRPDADEGGAA